MNSTDSAAGLAARAEEVRGVLPAAEDRLPPRQWRLHRSKSPRGRSLHQIQKGGERKEKPWETMGSQNGEMWGK